ncbi:TIGR03943 family putative permease subunit [Actinomadura macrotermitis]|uniref:TIGR03943 family protein n=1 Tax=Actinomadura macrotermitis TaxID=2585200 RepID=A0A7K0BV97_9ACTN|nr:TIGR03943 family protein [Actinomadura macrotermitis]MQY05105.1 hypothetical protein [Actinomadura macrotermitis]
MKRAAQDLLMILLGGTALWLVFSGEYTDYVKPGLRIPLVAAAVVLVLLGAAGLLRDSGEGHHHAPRVAWLLCLPVLAVFVIAPPALGAFTAGRAVARPAPPPAGDAGALDAGAGPVTLTLGEFIWRAYEAQTGQPSNIANVPVRLVGFVRPAKDGWYLTRLKMNCCAGDAIPFQVRVRGLPRPRAGSWVEVVGVWAPRKDGQADAQDIGGREVQPVKKPENPYE